MNYRKSAFFIILSCLILIISSGLPSGESSAKESKGKSLEKFPIIPADKGGDNVLSTEERLELLENHAVDTALREVEKKLIWKYGSIAAVVIIVFGSIFTVFSAYIIKNISILRVVMKSAKDFHKKSEGAIEQIELSGKKIEQFREDIGSCKDRIDGIKKDIEKALSSITKLEEEIKKSSETTDAATAELKEEVENLDASFEDKSDENSSPDTIASGNEVTQK